MKEINKYLKEVFGIQTVLRPMDNTELRKMPIYLKGSYRFYTGRLLNHQVIFADIIDSREVTPSQLKKQASDLTHLLKHPVVFSIPELESWNRARLIGQNVSFIEPGRQLFVPNLLLHLTDIPGRNAPTLKGIEKFSAPAQAILLYKLNSRINNSLQYNDMQAQFGYSAMTISRSVKELDQANIIEVAGGRTKIVNFILHGEELWRKTLPLLSSPVKEIWQSEAQLSGMNKYEEAGETALSNYTMLARRSGATYAIGKDVFHSFKKSKPELQKMQQRYGNYCLEVWNYDPKHIPADYPNTVDRLSLYLSMRDKIEDERMNQALEELLINMKW